MTVELTYLLFAAVLCFLQAGIATLGTIGNRGLERAAGNREDFVGDLPGWAGRAHRAHRNMLESLILFAIVVVIAHLAERNNDMTALGAQLFLWARLAYLVVYIIGVPWVRTGVWAVSIVGLVMIALQLV